MPDFTTLRTMMVDTQVRPSDVTKFPIIDAMLDVPREDFVPDTARDVAYAGAPIEIAAHRVVLEARTFAKMLDALDIRQDELVLHVGAGLGYGSAILARLAEAVVALEEDEGLAAEAETALAEVGADNVAVINGPLAQGHAKNAPYDVIVVDGGVAKLPTEIVSQLKPGGRIAAIFMSAGDVLGEMRIGVKTAGSVSWRMDFNATAPLLPGFEEDIAFEF